MPGLSRFARKVPPLRDPARTTCTPNPAKLPACPQPPLPTGLKVAYVATLSPVGRGWRGRLRELLRASTGS
jgi:hypothetical protein